MAEPKESFAITFVTRAEVAWLINKVVCEYAYIGEPIGEDDDRLTEDLCVEVGRKLKKFGDCDELPDDMFVDELVALGFHQSTSDEQSVEQRTVGLSITLWVNDGIDDERARSIVEQAIDEFCPQHGVSLASKEELLREFHN